MRRILRGLMGVFQTVFGVVHWTRPPWLQAINRKLPPPFGGGNQRQRWSRRGKKAAILSSFLFLIVLALAFYAFWYEPPLPPGVVELEARVVAPGLKPIGDEYLPKPLIINFNGSAARIEQVDKVLTEGPALNPKIAGEWRWVGDASLRFDPVEDWPIGTEFSLRFSETFLADQVVLPEYDYSFETSSFKASIERLTFEQDEADPTLKSVVAKISFSHPVDSSALEQRIRFLLADAKKKGEGETFGFETEYDKKKGVAFVRSHRIPIPMHDAKMTLTLAEGIRAAVGGPGTDEERTKSVTVPGMYSYFRIQSSELAFARNQENEPEQVLVISATTPVHEKQIRRHFKAWVLPLHKPALDGEKKRLKYSWGNTAEIGPRILDRSEPLRLEQIPGEREYGKLHSFRFKAQPGRYIYLQLKKGCKAWGGYVLADTFDRIFRVPEYPRELTIMHEGAILATSGQKKLSVMMRGLRGVAIELSRVLPRELNHFVSQTGGSFADPRFTGYSFDEENVAEIFVEKRALDHADPAKTQYTSIDFSKHLRSATSGISHGLFLLKVREWDPSHDTIRSRSDRRLVLVTDLGLLAKKDAKGDLHVFLQSIRSGKPRGGTLVDILGKNGLPVLTRRTDPWGYVKFPALTDFKREKEPVAIVARSGDDFSFLPFGRSDRSLNFSRFDVGGRYTDGKPDQLNAYLFSDRGIYRPGDQIHLGMIVKATDWRTELEGVPLQITITDPRGVKVFSDRVTLPASGFIEADYTTQESSPTGSYDVHLHLLQDDRIERMIGFTSVRVEEFLPDRMRIRAAFEPRPQEGWSTTNRVRARVSLHNLFGTPATNRRVTGRIALSAWYPSFKGYRDYLFSDPRAAKNTYNEALSELVTDEQGEVVFDIDLSKFQAATYALTFFAEGFEAEGGRSVSAKARMVVSPLDYLVGHKTDGGGLRFIDKESERKLHFIALGGALEKKRVTGLTAVLNEKRYVSTLVRQHSGLYRYESVERLFERSRKSLTIPQQGRSYPLPTDQPGEFVLTIENKDEDILAKIPFSVAGAANLTGSLERQAELSIKLDKKDYGPGEEIQISIKAPYAGAGIITIEQDKVYGFKWFASDTKTSVQTITVPRDVAVNAYVNVAFTRKLDSPQVFMKPLCYAVQPFSLKRTDRIQEIALEVPELVEPGQKLTIGYTTGTPSRIVVFAVDEGILQVAGYKTPDPLGHFLAKRALEVSTTQILDMLLPESRSFHAPSKTGGGDEEEEGLGQNLNPFKRKREKPVVYWSGIVDADQTRREVSYDVPIYFNGSMQVMAVAVARDRLGASQTKTTVRGPFVIYPNAPVFAAPGDQFEVSASVTNNIEGSGAQTPVAVSLTASDNLEIIGADTQKLQLGEGREATVRFQVRALPSLGNATLTFTAKHKGKKVDYDTTLSVRPVAPRMTTLKAGSVRDGKKTVPVERQLYREYRKLKVSVSPLPLVLADGLTDYLEKFPHGCTEQLVSQAVPALVFGGHPEFGFNRAVSRRAVARAIRMLRVRQNEEGAFGYWAANSHVSDYQVAYATLFLTEAKERGHALPGEMLHKAITYLKMVINERPDSLTKARLNAFAIYVLARNGKLAPGPLAGLREYLALDKERRWHKDIILGYLAATYRLMQDRREAGTLVGEVDLGAATGEDLEAFYDAQSYRGMMLYLLARHFSERLEEIPAAAIDSIADDVARGRYNTISSAQIIYGLEAYGKAVNNSQGANRAETIRVFEVDEAGQKKPVSLEGKLIARGAFTPTARQLEVQSESDLPAFFSVSVAGFDRDDQPIEHHKHGVEIFREYRTVEGKPIEKVGLGAEIEAVIKLRSLGDAVANLAVVDLLPAGFEVVINSDASQSGGGRISTPASTWRPEYADVREDRVVLYGGIGSSVKTFVFRIKAIAKGRFAVPPAHLVSLYNPEIQANTGTDVIVVGEPH